jgi:hypothetical protein
MYSFPKNEVVKSSWDSSTATIALRTKQNEKCWSEVQLHTILQINYWTFILNPEQRRVFQLVIYTLLPTVNVVQRSVTVEQGTYDCSNSSLHFRTKFIKKTCVIRERVLILIITLYNISFNLFDYKNDCMHWFLCFFELHCYGDLPSLKPIWRTHSSMHRTWAVRIPVVRCVAPISRAGPLHCGNDLTSIMDDTYEVFSFRSAPLSTWFSRQIKLLVGYRIAKSEQE